MSDPSGQHVDEVLPDLALGLLEGPLLAGTLAHVDDCERCRRELDELLRATDALLQAAPVAEPPAGFEAAVIARMGKSWSKPATRVVPARWFAAAAAALLLVAGGAVLAERRQDTPPAQVASAVLARQRGGGVVGWAWLLPGEPGRLAVDMSYGDPAGSLGYGGVQTVPVQVELVDADGAVVERHEVLLTAGAYNGIVRLDGDGAAARSVRMRRPDGAVLCHGRLA